MNMDFYVIWSTFYGGALEFESKNTGSGNLTRNTEKKKRKKSGVVELKSHFQQQEKKTGRTLFVACFSCARKNCVVWEHSRMLYIFMQFIFHTYLAVIIPFFLLPFRCRCSFCCFCYRLFSPSPRSYIQNRSCGSCIEYTIYNV